MSEALDADLIRGVAIAIALFVRNGGDAAAAETVMQIMGVTFDQLLSAQIEDVEREALRSLKRR